MTKLTQPQQAVLVTATPGTAEVLGRDARGYPDYSAPRRMVTGLVVTGHRNILAGLRSKGLVRTDTAGASNRGMLTTAGEVALQAL